MKKTDTPADLVVYELQVWPANDDTLILIEGLFTSERKAAVAANRYLAEHFHYQIAVREITKSPYLRVGARFRHGTLVIQIRPRIVK